MIRKLSRSHMQHQFLPDIVFLATPETPARMLGVVEEMVEVLAKVIPPKPEPVKKAAPRPPIWAEPEKNGTAKAEKPKAPAIDESKTRNLVSNQVSARRRGTMHRGR